MALRTRVLVWQLLWAVGCASSPLLRAADAGDLKTLRVEIDARHKAGKITNDEAAEIGRRVIGHELQTALRDDALKRVRDVRACAFEIDDSLAERMKTHDPAGAEAAMARLDMGKLDAEEARAFVADRDDRWRAVGARGLTREEDRPARLHALLDPSPLVRRAAVRASADPPAAADSSETAALAEAARVDPEPMVRSEAVRALGRLGGERTSVLLQDLWVNADDGMREDIALAWASPDIFAHGGSEPLRVLIASKTGPGAIEGAAAVLRLPSGPSRELRDSSIGLLVRTIALGSRRDRMHAIAVAPLPEKDILAALHTASREEDIETKISAHARLLESAGDRADAVRSLEALAQNHGALSARARLALASAGDLRIQAWIEADLTAVDPSVRLSAAGALAALGRSARGAPLLADADPQVRARAACTLLAAARVGR